MTHNGLVFSVTFSADGRYVLSAGDITVRLWEAATGKEIVRMTHDGSVEYAAFSPDGRYVLSRSGNSARVWEIAANEEVARMLYDGLVNSVAFSPDGRYVLTGGVRTARVWFWQSQDLIANACEYMPRNLSRMEWQQYIGNALPYQAVCPNLPIEAEATSMP
jgi:WD40 repeat protein